MSKRKILVRGKDFLLFMIGVFASVFVLLMNRHEFNKLSFILPLVFSACYLFLLAPVRNRTKSKTVFWFAIAETLRLVFVPCFEAVSSYVGFYGFSTQDSSLLHRAVLLMAYECVFVSVFLVFATRNMDSREHEDLGDNIAPLGRDRVGLAIIVIIGIIIFFAVPEVRKNINFFLLESNSEKVRALTAGSHSSLVTGLIALTYDAFLCLFILVLDWAKNRFVDSEKKGYVFLAVVMGLLTVSVINGESRSTLVYTLYAVVICLRGSFRQYAKFITRVLVIAGVLVLVGMTTYRLFSVYKYGSYQEAVVGGSLRDNYFPAFVEMYFLGPQSVACGLKFCEEMSSQFSIATFLYDIFRPFMGLNFIAERFGGKTSIMMFNSWFSGVQGKSNGIFLQITNQGYDYFGFIFAPVFTCFFYWISVWIEKKLATVKSLFIAFFLNMILIRTSTCVVGGTMSGYITQITMIMLICGALYLGQKAVTSTLNRRL